MPADKLESVQVNTPHFDLLDSIISWESGEMDEAEEVELFQHLIDSGLAWQLQGMYGRRAKYLIDAGYCHPVGGR